MTYVSGLLGKLLHGEFIRTFGAYTVQERLEITNFVRVFQYLLHHRVFDIV